MQYAELLRGLNYAGEAPAGLATRVTFSLAKVVPGAVFVCIKGATSDGHIQAHKALAAGAGMVVSQRPLGLPCEVTVEDSRAAYGRLCANFFGNPAEKLTLVAVTGTNGKSTVAHLLRQVLEACGASCGLIGTIANEIGALRIPAKFTTPEAWDLNALFARMVRAGCSHAVLEASSQALDQCRLYGLHFAVGVFTNLSQDHLDYHKTMERYFAAKKLMLAQSNRVLINADDEWGQRLLASGEYPGAKCFGLSAGSDYCAVDVQLSATGAEFSLCTATGERQALAFGMPGEYSVSNALAAAGAAIELGFSMTAVAAALERAEGVPGRCEVLYKGKFTVICDFAHTEDALAKVLGALRPFAGGRLIALFGCPGERDRSKRPKMAAAVAKYADVIFLTSDNPRGEDPAAIIREVLPALEGSGRVLYAEPDRGRALRLALEQAQEGDVLVLCGKGHEDYQANDVYTQYFSERHLVREFVQGL